LLGFSSTRLRPEDARSIRGKRGKRGKRRCSFDSSAAYALSIRFRHENPEKPPVLLRFIYPDSPMRWLFRARRTFLSGKHWETWETIEKGPDSVDFFAPEAVSQMRGPLGNMGNRTSGLGSPVVWKAPPFSGLHHGGGGFNCRYFWPCRARFR
jgi:hypothetical protein